MAKSTMGKWRALVLIGVHAAIVAHILQWLYSGMQTGERRTISPVEPSESMYTLELGQINAGFVFFCAAILSTLLFGRWFCGWGCHIVGLQDLCAWLMNKCGIHPKPWRSRLLTWVPLGLALYMFVWPVFRRSALAPLLTKWLGGVPGWVGQTAPLHGFTNDFIVEDFWKTFAPWHVGIFFLLICGFAIVYMLGSKSFCTYGCPYGGFFSPVDRFSPLRIRVNDNCHQCGHCTAVCSSNVRVAEEVRDYGMVVDPGCFKCLDCVSVCPNDALRVGFGAPALFATPRVGPEQMKATREKAKARYDLSLAEELFAASAFLVLFRGFRGMPFLGEHIPLLMAVGIAAIGTFMLNRLWRIVRDLNVRGPRVQLKLAGRLTWGGYCFTLATLLLTAIGVAGASSWFVTSMGEGEALKIDKMTTTAPGTSLPTVQAVYAPGYIPDPEAKAIALRALSWLRLARPVWEGGVGLDTTWDAEVRSVWLSAVAGNLEDAKASILRARSIRTTDDLVLGQAKLTRLIAGKGKEYATDSTTLDQIETLFRDALARDQDLHDVRFELSSLLASRGKIEEASTLLEEAARRNPGDTPTVRQAALGLMNMPEAKPERAIAVLRKGLELRPKSAALHADLASLLLLTQKMTEGREQTEIALKLKPDEPEVVGRIAECLNALSRLPEAVPLAEFCLERHPRDIGAIRNAAGLHVATGNQARALEIMRGGAERLPASSLLRTELAGLLQQMGRNDEALIELRKVIASDPKDPQTWVLISELAGIMNLAEEVELARVKLASMGLAPPK